jgi:hypothetical protein|tara:strand:+ start:4864 stop:6963 length:2100 start_codon:yes stop_codon:yes gene_type:complete
MSETFHNGSGKRVTLPDDAGPNPEVTAVEVEKKEGQPFTNLDRSLWTVKTVASSAGQVTTVELDNFYSAVKVYYVQNFTRAQIEDSIGKDKADQLAAAESEMEGVAKEIIKDLQFDKLNLEGASTKNFEELGGMKGIMDMVKKNHAITKRPMMAKATENIGDGTAKGSSNQMASIASITGAPKSFGFLKKISTQFTATANKKITKKTFPQFTEKKLNKISSKVAINPAKGEVSLQPENEPKKKASVQLARVYKEKVKTGLNNASADRDPLSPFGGIGMPGGNMFAQLMAKGKGVVGTGSGNPFEEVKGASFNPDKFKNFIDTNLNTNIRSNVSVGDTIKASPSNIKDTTSAGDNFSGFNTPSSYVFEKIPSLELLIGKFKNSSRRQSKGKDKFGCIIFGWTKHLVGSPNKVDASEIHRLTKIYDRNNLINSLGSIEKADDEIQKKPIEFGIQPHFVILRNGDIQEGRPLNVTRNKNYQAYALSGVKVTFVASDTAPATTKQMDSFNIMIRAWLTITKGSGQVLSDFEVSDEYDGPGFDAKELVKSIHDVEFLISSPSDLEEIPDPKELAMTKPNKIAKATTGGSFPKDLDSVDKDIKKRVESEAFQKDVNNAKNVFENETGTAVTSMKDKIDELSAAGKLPQGLDKGLKDIKIGNLEGLVKGSGGKIDSVVNSLQSAPNQTLGQREKLAKDLFNKFSVG